VGPNDPARLLHDLGRRIAELRASRHLTQEAFAERLGVTSRYVQRIESGSQNVSVQVLAAFANGLGVKLAELFRPPRAQSVAQVRRKRGTKPASRRR
jgi:transcriptional regulator with XRE-family HTH domain